MEIFEKISPKPFAISSGGIIFAIPYRHDRFFYDSNGFFFKFLTLNIYI